MCVQGIFTGSRKVKAQTNYQSNAQDFSESPLPWTMDHNEYVNLIHACTCHIHAIISLYTGTYFHQGWIWCHNDQ